MIKEILIKYDEKNTSKKGAFFESLVNKIFQAQRYQVTGNVNFTGMEFDLLCKHLDRENETVIVECKAKDSLSSRDLNLFAFNVQDKEYRFGYFLYTRNFAHQVAGRIEEMRNDSKSRYENLYFWDAPKIFELLESSNNIKIFNINHEPYNLSKLILIYSHYGFYYVTLFSNTTLPKYFSIFDAKTLEPITDNSIIEKIKSDINEIEQLEFKSCSEKNKDDFHHNNTEITKEFETIIDMQESSSWDDTKPASMQYFVGRTELRKRIVNFLDEVKRNSTTQRIFHIDGKSGWGKSSFLVELRGRFRNKYYKNKYFAYVADSRSANSQNFIALAFTKMIENAIEQKFIDKRFSSIIIPSYFDILKTKELYDLLCYLTTKNKLLILIFDQFEDIFRKEKIFQSFYKFLIDINDIQSNLILGFSWKSETFIPIDEKNLSQLLTQSKELSLSITLPEFNSGESKNIIKQLEEAIDDKLDPEFTRKIIDNSQGFPWLVKKLCIHIYKEYLSGNTLSDLYEQNLNVQILFDKDSEGLNPDEVRALKYIAKRAYDNNMFDVMEVGEKIEEQIITSLTHKRLVIKSGTKYNIYWDIFRDYLVTDNVPKVGETYLIRHPVNSVWDMLSTFQDNKYMTLAEIIENAPNSVNTGSGDNLMRELRNIGLVQFKDGRFSLKEDSFTIKEENFKQYLKNKLQNHSFYLELQKIQDKEIALDDISNIIIAKIKTGRQYKSKTLLDYSQNFINWLNYAELTLPTLKHKILQKAKNVNTFTPQEKPKNVINYFKGIIDFQEYTKKDLKFLYDLKALNLLTYRDNKIYLTTDGKNAKKNDDDFNNIICRNALKAEKIKIAVNIYKQNLGTKSKDFRKLIPHLLEGISSKVYLQSTSRKLYEWANYIYNNSNT